MKQFAETDISECFGVSISGLPIERCPGQRRGLDHMDFPTVSRPWLDLSVDLREAVPKGRWASFGGGTKSIENLESYWRERHTSGDRSEKAVKTETVYQYSFSYFWSGAVRDWFQKWLSVFTAIVEPLVPARNSTSSSDDIEPAVASLRGSVPGFLKNAHQQLNVYIGSGQRLENKFGAG